jgi:hypothetical protein
MEAPAVKLVSLSLWLLGLNEKVFHTRYQKDGPVADSEGLRIRVLVNRTVTFVAVAVPNSIEAFSQQQRSSHFRKALQVIRERVQRFQSV